MKVIISREYGTLETTGCFYVFNGNESIFNCKTIELPDKGNQHNISCIPAGEYKVVKTISPSKGECFHVLDVPGRSHILIHIGNYATGSKVDTQGCILVGSRFADINNDGNIDVVESTITLRKLLKILPDKFILHII